MKIQSCLECPARSKCVKLCKKMERYVNGNAPLKEPLLRDIIGDQTEVSSNRDYKAVLNDLAEDRQERIEYALSIPNVRDRAIAALIMVGITRKEISDMFFVSYRHLSRIINNNPQLKAIKHLKTASSD